MPAKHSSAFRVLAALGLGLSLTACGPIAFQDTVNFKLAQPEPEPPKVEGPPARARLTGTHIEIDDKIQFEKGSAEILAVSHELLDEVVKVMTDNPQVEQVSIIGHTSSEGSLKLNKKLSADRADAVEQYLVGHGIDAGRLTSEGKGPSEPIADNATEEGKEANRRVEFKVTKMGAAAAAAEPSAKAESGGARGRPGT